jgi:hypothetical protein
VISDIRRRAGASGIKTTDDFTTIDGSNIAAAMR